MQYENFCFVHVPYYIEVNQNSFGKIQQALEGTNIKFFTIQFVSKIAHNNPEEYRKRSFISSLWNVRTSVFECLLSNDILVGFHQFRLLSRQFIWPIFLWWKDSQIYRLWNIWTCRSIKWISQEDSTARQLQRKNTSLC